LENPIIITIDGPAGAGKSTIAVRLAQRLSIAYLDTGAMYRAVTLAAIRKNVSLDDPAALEKLARELSIEFTRSDNRDCILIDRVDVTDAIRQPEVTTQAHKIASVTAVREVLVQQQRRIAQEHRHLVTEGRDQGSVVFTQAQFKFYLDASCQCRARRRYEQLQLQGIEANYEKILADQRQRDQRDTSRRLGPLKIPDDAIVIDTTEMDIEQVVDTLYRHVKSSL